ncbi:MAG: hypothetical protein U0172_12965 [Nitrospiraceae bacterium]
MWVWLTSDVTVLGGIRSPLVSWLGVVALAVFCAWHVGRLTRTVRALRQAFARVQDTLSELAGGRSHIEEEWLKLPTQGAKADGANGGHPASGRIDLDDIHAIDRALRAEPLFQRAWAQFRKTYVLEHTSWFIEPRVFSTQSAQGYFPQDQLLSSRLNMAFYHQLPTMLTGIGLLFTFLAILIGLSKLHADATHITGIQGLINGLAGKFLTSIVGLVCANLFVMWEKSMLFGLSSDHHRFVTTLDELFPRRTVEQMLENCSTVGSQDGGLGAAKGARPGAEPGKTELLMPSIKALTAAVEQLGRRTEPVRAPRPVEGGALAADVAKGIREGVTAPINDLQNVIRELTQSVGEFKASQEQTQRRLDELAGRMGDDLSDLVEVDAVGDSRVGLTGTRWFDTVRARIPSRRS